MRKLLILALILCFAVGLPAQQRARMLSGVNYQTGALPYTFVPLDATRLTTFTGGASQTANLPNPSTVGFGVGYLFSVYVQGVGDLTITATAATIGGSASINLTTGQGVDIYSDGVNYSIQGGKGTGGGGGGGGAIGPVGTVQASDGAGHFQITGEVDDGSNLTADRNTTFLGPNPIIDVTRYGVRSVTGNIQTTGSIGATSHALTVADGSQYINGDGIVVRGAGTNCPIATPSAPTVTASNASVMLNTGLTSASGSGGTAYQYQVVAVSRDGCYTPASPVAAIANGQATLGATTVNIASWTRANNVVTVTTSSPHTLTTNSMVWLTPFSIDGFYQVTGTSDNTHFTVAEGQDTRNGAIASGGAGGTATYWVGNHISWASKAGTMKYLIYGRTSGSMVLLGVSLPDSATFGLGLLTTDPLYNTFDDWGSTITLAPTVPEYYPATPPGAGKNNDLITTISSGGGTNNIVTNDAATNTVASVVVKFDNTKPFQNAITATYGGSAQRGVLRFPVTSGPTDFYLFTSMFSISAFPSTVSIQQDGSVGFNDTVLMGLVEWNGNNPLSSNQFSFSKNASINSGSAHPILYGVGQKANLSNLSIGGFSNSQNLVVIDAGGIPASSFYNVNFNNTGTDWAGQSLIIRNNISGASDFDFKNVSFSGGPSITDKDPTPLFQATQGLSEFNFDRVFLNRRGMYIGANTNGTQGVINNIYCQGCIMPKVTLGNSTAAGFVSTFFKMVNSIIDTPPVNVPEIAYFGSQKGTIQFSGSNGLGNSSQMINGNGSMALDLIGVGQASNIVGQNVFVRNIPSAGHSIPGAPYSTSSVDYPLQKSDMALSVGAPFSIFVNSLKQAAPTCSNTGVGTVPNGSYTFIVAPVFANGGEGTPSNTSAACTSNGSQQITINWTLAPGAIGYNLYRNGFSFQCVAPWVSGGATLSYVWISVVPCGIQASSDAGSGPSGITSGEVFTPQIVIPSTDGGGFGTLTAPSLTSNPAWTMPDNAGVGIFTPNPTTPVGVPQVPVYIPGTTPVNSSGAYALQGVTPNAQSGATYTIVATDRSKVVTFNNAAETYVTIPQAGTAGFTSNIAYRLFNRGVGLVVLTPTTSTINGLSQLTITSNMFCTIMSDNTNYLANCETYSPFNIDNYGAVGDLTTFSASLTSGTTALTCVGCTFTTKDVGKTVLIQGASGGLLAYTDTIAAFVNATSVTLTTGTSSTTVTNSTSAYGTDNSTAIAAALTAAGNVPSPSSGLVVIPANESYLTRTAFTIPGNVSVQLDGHLTGSNGIAAVLQTTTNTVAPFWEHQRIFGIGVLSLGNSAFRGIWMHQGRHNDISGINVRAMGQTNSIGIQVGDPTAGQVGGYETMISHVSFGTHSVSGGSNSRCVSIDNTTNGRFTDSQTDALVGNGCATGIFDGQGGDRNSNGHFWGPSLATAYNGTGDFWIGMEADTPSSVGFEVTANEQIIGSRCFFGSTGTDNTATCVHSATTEPPMVISGLRIQGVDGSHRWSLDSNLLRVNLTVSTISGVQSTNVVTQNISGNAIIPGGGGGGAVAIFGGTGAAFSVSPEYVSAVLGTNGGPTTGITDLQTPIASAKTIGNFYVHLQTAVAGAASVTYTLVKNGTATAVTCTVAAAGTACNDTTHTFTTAAGDLLNMQITFTGTPGNITQFWSFTEQ